MGLVCRTGYSTANDGAARWAHNHKSKRKGNKTFVSNCYGSLLGAAAQSYDHSPPQKQNADQVQACLGGTSC